MLKLGETPRNHSPLFWKGIPNGHAFISGQSGSGKSYFLRGLVLQLLHQGKVRVIILDASHDLAGGLPASPGIPQNYLDRIAIIDVKSDTFTLNPLRPQPQGAGSDEGSYEAACRMTETLRTVCRMRPELATYVTNSLADYLDLNDGAGSVPGFLEFTRNYLDKDERKRIGLAIERLRNFSRAVHCGEGNFEWKLDTPGVTVIDFSRVPTEQEQCLLVELSLGDIWGQRLRKQDSNVPTVIVLDECQKFKFGPSSFTTKLLREGRKYRMSAWLASQWVSDKEALAALEQAALRAYFRPEPSNVHALAQRLAAGDRELTKTYESHLGRLKRGQFLYHDQNGRPIIANVPSRMRP